MFISLKWKGIRDYITCYSGVKIGTGCSSAVFWERDLAKSGLCAVIGRVPCVNTPWPAVFQWHAWEGFSADWFRGSAGDVWDLINNGLKTSFKNFQSMLFYLEFFPVDISISLSFHWPKRCTVLWLNNYFKIKNKI